jgi:SAM-dependent methyltransferase
MAISYATEHLDSLDFTCNICATAVRNCPVDTIDREVRSCPQCGSTVRFRCIAYLLSKAIYGRAVPVSQFETNRRAIAVIGLSDWHVLTDMLQSRLNFTNTFIHQEPRLDITTPGTYKATADILISSEVFEHVPPPVQRAFDGAFSVLKPGGHLILSVPYTLHETTAEHFPDLFEYRLVDLNGTQVLVNRGRNGKLSARSGLVFHGGQGDTLEMRVFCENAVLRHLSDAGFVDIQVMRHEAPEWGILHKHPWSLPITARRPR